MILTWLVHDPQLIDVSLSQDGIFKRFLTSYYNKFILKTPLMVLQVKFVPHPFRQNFKVSQ